MAGAAAGPAENAEDEVLRRLKSDPETAELIPLFGEDSSRVRWEIRRFLLAKNGCVEAGTAKAKRSLKWRAQRRPFDVVPDEIRLELASGKVKCLGTASDNVAWYVLRGGDHYGASQPGGFHREDTIKLMFAILRHAESHGTNAPDGPPTRLAFVVDLEGFGWSNVDRGLLKDLGMPLVKYCPERIHGFFVVNPGLVVRMIWPPIRLMAPAKRLRLVHFITDATTLAASVGGDVAEWPVQYGGEVEVDDGRWLAASIAALTANTPFQGTSSLRAVPDPDPDEPS